MQRTHISRFVIGAVAMAMVMAGSADAVVYRYKKNGVWHFTDNPTEVPTEQMDGQTIAASPETSPGTDLKNQLVAALKPTNEIETAVLATVAVETAFGYGTGFFISGDGYILTNKHVIRKLTGPGTADDPTFANKAEALDRYEAQIDAEARKMAQVQDDLEDFRRFLDSQPESPSRQFNETRYEERMRQFKSWQKSIDEHRQKLKSERSAFEATLLQQRVDTNLAGLNRNFTIYLADNTPLYAYVVDISKTHDLALLKVDGYATPFLKPGNPYATAQGEPVYAIGNPAKLRNSVTSGVVSGFEGPFVKTNAQIYPGNSGGPLVTSDGRAIGINTFKTLTRKFEGLGFAISITVALDAFDAI